MDWEELLQALIDCVPPGRVTTYGKLAVWAYGHPGAAQAIIAMLNAAVHADYENRVWTNRVVNQQGGIFNGNDAREQLAGESIPILPDGRINLHQCPPVNIAECMEMGGQREQDGGNQDGSYQGVDDNILDLDEEILVFLRGLTFPQIDRQQNFTWTGFDSAWAGNNPGAIAWMTGDSDGLYFNTPKQAGFDDCIRFVDSENVQSDMHILMIDQPTIVENDTGFRPVEKAIGHEMGRAGSAVQPANPGRPNMFGENAPIWSFLEKLKERGFQESTAKAWNADSGFFYLETYPAFGNLGLFGYEKCPKYNPGNQNFNIKDWQTLCHHIGQVGTALNIEGLQTWVSGMRDNASPTKTDQDLLDAVLCMLFGYVWWRSGLKHSVIIGDSKTGYMVIPCLRRGLRATLKSDAVPHNVPVDILFPKESVAAGREGENCNIPLQRKSPEQDAQDLRDEFIQAFHVHVDDYEATEQDENGIDSTSVEERKKEEGVKNEKRSQKSFIAWLERIFQRE